MNSKAYTIASLAAVLVLSATAAAAVANDGSLTAADEDAAVATPADQSNSADALQVTTRIRKAVVADKSLSVSAHNVKIITTGNTVTLRGPVASSAEKERIATLARQNARGKDVLDQITVKGV